MEENTLRENHQALTERGESTRDGLRYRTSGKCGYETITHSFKETRRISLTTANSALFALTPVRSQLDFTKESWILRPHKTTDDMFHVTCLLFSINLDGLSRNLQEIYVVSNEVLLYAKITRNENMYIQYITLSALSFTIWPQCTWG